VRGAPAPSATDARRRPTPTIAQVAGVLLDAVLLDAMEADIEHSARVNASVLRCGGRSGHPDDFREIDVLWLRPSTSIGALAGELADHIPMVVRYLLRGLGDDEATRELASYLLFDTTFCGKLVELGRADVYAGRTEIERFFLRTARPASQRG